MKKVFVILLVFLILAGFFVFLGASKKKKTASTSTKTEVGVEKWEEEGLRIGGNYCDAEIVRLDDGRLRIYYALEPEVPGFAGQIYSAVSEDGLNFKEEGEVMQGATFPSVIKLPDGRWRMYYQKAGAIRSSISEDGLRWTEEKGARIEKGEKGSYDDNNVASPTVIQLKNGQYKMIYRGSVKGKYDPYSQQDEITRLLSATSSDGLVWQKEPGIAVDSMNEEFHGQVDGPELVYWDDGSLKLYFQSFSGVYVSEISEDGRVSSPKMVLKARGPEHAPSDVTILKIGEKWRMYFGIHTKGIYSAVLK